MRRIVVSFAFVTLTAGCASTPPRVLSVRSEPADAEVCIKGKAQNKHVPPVKYCVGSTPLELSAVKINENGRPRVIQFNDIEDENFYLIVQRPGYAPTSVQVPAWDHHVNLHAEGVKEAAPAPAAQVSVKGMAKITSNPVGALVYVNDFLKGNTPYVLEAEASQTVRLKIEQAGYRTIERSITVEAGRAMELNLQLLREAPVANVPAKAEPQRKPASASAEKVLDEESEQSDDDAEE